MSKKPHEDTALATYIRRRVSELKPKKSQLQIATEAGFPNPNMVTMIKNGTSKLDTLLVQLAHDGPPPATRSRRKSPCAP